ncbi:nitroreductase family deazaflavin-dependent oxidoreductase [Kribbella deserti]|uniref:Nitroreductase family deazaflavin-dependent oxidoreductase n=1 Tax=Kribbella deserti TaxID=1926257 RepID=A0ABV6QDD4_9ACTN
MNTDNDYIPSPTQWVREAVETIESAGDTKAAGINGMSVVLITMKGAKTGAIRKVPLMRIEHEGVYAAVASDGGAPKNPVWYHNLVKNPTVTLQDGTEIGQFVAREVSGAERDLWWQRALEVYAEYAEYQKKTERIIPVFLLEPTKG